MSDRPRTPEEWADGLVGDIAGAIRQATADAEARVREQEVAPLVEACQAACAYFQMLENATGVEHGNLAMLRAVLARERTQRDRTAGGPHKKECQP